MYTSMCTCIYKYWLSLHTNTHTITRTYSHFELNSLLPTWLFPTWGFNSFGFSPRVTSQQPKSNCWPRPHGTTGGVKIVSWHADWPMLALPASIQATSSATSSLPPSLSV